MLDRRRIFFYYIGNAAVVKLADTPDSGSGEATHAGSSPVSRKALPEGKGCFFARQFRRAKKQPGSSNPAVRLLLASIFA